MARDEYLQHLASVRLFSKCTKRQLQEIGKVAKLLNWTSPPGGFLLVRVKLVLRCSYSSMAPRQ